MLSAEPKRISAGSACLVICTCWTFHLSLTLYSCNTQSAMDIVDILCAVKKLTGNVSRNEYMVLITLK